MLRTTLLVAVFAVPIFPVQGQVVDQNSSSTPDALKQLIDQKSQELNAINEQITSTSVGLDQVKSQGQSISKEVSGLNSTIRQLNLKIQAGEITTEKLRLQLQDLSYSMADIAAGISDKKESIATSLRLLQQKEGDNALVIFLRTKSLSDSVVEAQNLLDLNNSLAVDITNLKTLQDEMAEKIDTENQHKTDLERQTANAKNLQEITADQKRERERLLALTKAQQRDYEMKLAELEDQQQEISNTIEDLEYKLRAQFDPSILPPARTGVLGYPVANPRITQNYGVSAFAQKAYKSGAHNGVDFGASIGTPIFAADDGVVLAVDNNDAGTSRWQKYQYGKYVLLKHDNNLATLYGHLSRQIVSVGQAVKRGDVIGYSGDTGYATGPHLHFGVYWEPSIQLKSISPARGLVPIGVTIDPMTYL